MASRRPGTDFENRFFDLLMDRMDKQDAKLDEIHKQVRYTNGRVTALEKLSVKFDTAITSLESKRGKKFNLDPKTGYILALTALGIVVTVAAVLHVDLRGIL